MKDLLKAGQVLGRSEMKRVMAGSGGDCDYNVYCFRAEDYSPVTNCTVCVRIDQQTCVASCDDRCCLV